MLDSRSQILARRADPDDIAMQTRTYPTADREMELHAAVDTLKYMGFRIDATDAPLGTVSATDLVDPDIHYTVTIRQAGANTTIIRANGNRLGNAITNSGAYARFFASLEQTMSLQATR